MAKEKTPEEKKVVFIDPSKIEELQKMLDEIKSEQHQSGVEVIKKINGAAKDAAVGKIDPEKRYALIETGRFRAIEVAAKKLTAIPIEPEKPKAPSNIPYLITIVIMVAIGISGALYYLSIRPEENFVVVAGAMFVIITPVTTSIMAFMQSRDTNKAVNSRLEAFIESEGRVEFEKGKDKGRHDAEDRADVLASTSK